MSVLFGSESLDEIDEGRNRLVDRSDLYRPPTRIHSDVSRVEGDDNHAFWTQLEREGFGEGIERTPAGYQRLIVRPVHRADRADRHREVDHPGARALLKQRKKGLQDAQRRDDIDGERMRKIVLGHLAQVLGLLMNTGVVDQHVQMISVLRDLFASPRELGGVGHVQLEDGEPVSMLPPKLL